MDNAFGVLHRRHPDLVSTEFEFACGPGWIDILDRYFTALEHLVPTGNRFRPLQVKEKFGGLRIYHIIGHGLSGEAKLEPGRQRDLAEARSFHVCNVCGCPARLWMWNNCCQTACGVPAETLNQKCHEGRRLIARAKRLYYPAAKGWTRYDPILDDLVPSLPPPGWEDRDAGTPNQNPWTDADGSPV